MFKAQKQQQFPPNLSQLKHWMGGLKSACLYAFSVYLFFRRGKATSIEKLSLVWAVLLEACPRIEKPTAENPFWLSFPTKFVE